MRKSNALVRYEHQKDELRKRFRAGEINDRSYRARKVEVLRRALPKVTLEELAELDRQSFDLLTEQKRRHA
jgi:hypothetical protein